MAPKSKKKADHNHSKVHPSITKSRERQRIQSEKRTARFLKMSKSKGKQANPSVASSSIDDGNIAELFHYEKSDEENEVQENADSLLSPSHQPGTSRAEGQELSHPVGSSKGNKARFDHVSVQEKPPINTQSEDLKIQKNTAETKHRRSNVSLTSPSTSQNLPRNYSEVEKLHEDQQAKTQLGARSKISLDNRTVKKPLLPQNLISRTSVQEKVHVATQTEVPQTQGQGFKRFKNFPETALASSLSTPLAYSVNIKQQKDETKTQMESRNAEFAREIHEALTSWKPIKDTEFAKRNLKLDPVQACRKHPEELEGRKNLLQQKLEKIESKIKSVKEQEKRLIQLASRKNANEPELAVSGMITVFSSNDSDKISSAKAEMYSLKQSNTRILQISEKNIQITIAVLEGTQIVCNVRKHLDTDDIDSCCQTLKCEATVKSEKDATSDPQQQDEASIDSNISSKTGIFSKKNISSGGYSNPNIESCSQILEGKAISRSDEDVISDPKHREKTNTDSSTETSKEKISSGAYSNPDAESCSRTLEGKPTFELDKGVISDPMHHEEIKTDPNIESSKKNISSGPSSVKENIQNVCANFLKECTSACESFATRVVNSIKKKEKLN